MKHLRTYFILTIIAFVIASCTDGEQMRQRLAEVQACNQTDTVFSSRWLPTVDSLVDYFDSHGASIMIWARRHRLLKNTIVPLNAQTPRPQIAITTYWQKYMVRQPLSSWNS